ncbi:rhodanese-like domain-containing protein [Massilia glaciei]|uniref:Sulfurtransferase n=1 Tax=Massilia glaciei TaxID=1524097 RepID=A0A2U2I5C5_9BURK|nr:rhodanese-like domain-containing protein [Massilia glaciei]PWF54927.1 sulfurtransferase [Massilia glaciei]
MPNFVELLLTYGVFIVFALVLVEQLGLPIPAFPILLVAGALAVGGRISWQACWAVAVLACLISDLFWFRAGRFYGKRVLRLLCKISLSPDYCVSQTEDKFKRFGAKSLLVSKFVPGFNIVAAPLAGAMGTGTARFLAFSIGGSVFWSATALATGAMFHRSVDAALAFLSTLGATALVVVFGLLAVFVLYKYIERRRFLMGVQIERIGVAELLDLIGAGGEPVLIDARSVTARQFEAAIPGALIYGDSEPAILMAAIDKDRHIVVYCSCPNDVTAAQVAKQFLADGFHRARALHGGLDAWNAHRGGVHAGATDFKPAGTTPA